MRRQALPRGNQRNASTPNGVVSSWSGMRAGSALGHNSFRVGRGAIKPKVAPVRRNLGLGYTTPLVLSVVPPDPPLQPVAGGSIGRGESREEQTTSLVSSPCLHAVVAEWAPETLRDSPSPVVFSGALCAAPTGQIGSRRKTRGIGIAQPRAVFFEPFRLYAVLEHSSRLPR